MRAKKLLMRSRFVALLAITALVSAAIAFSAAQLVGPAPTPKNLKPSSRITSIDVSQSPFLDETPVGVNVSVGAAQKIVSPSSGIVTSMNCVEGDPINTKSTLMGIDGRSLISIVSTTPPWRDIKLGYSGDDVLGLEEFLVKRGFEQVNPDGYWSWGDYLGYVDLRASLGLKPLEAAVVKMEDVVWVPSAQKVATCSVSIGDRISAGDVIAELPSGISSAKLAFKNPPRVAGERVLNIGDEAFPIPSEGVVTDPKTLGAISESPQLAQMLRDKETSLELPTRLAKPLQVTAVPPGSIYSDKENRQCVYVGGRAHAVKVVASELGLSLITPEGADTLSRIDLRPQKNPSC